MHPHFTQVTDHLIARMMLATNPTFDVGFITDVIDEPSHIRFDIPAPSMSSTSTPSIGEQAPEEEDAMGETDHEYDE